ncbi:uncharacterized protein LOC134195453 [Corticium candelabrum]|uniref:uncharacterized protein LOC134195453 n=1 Tax=Corticium candelabrum TaxID=121492 RepID=UPI002E25E8DF|nr:uncharacterized protein LOC134195453 [Corticium candelabrum]
MMQLSNSQECSNDGGSSSGGSGGGGGGGNGGNGGNGGGNGGGGGGSNGGGGGNGDSNGGGGGGGGNVFPVDIKILVVMIFRDREHILRYKTRSTVKCMAFTDRVAG